MSDWLYIHFHKLFNFIQFDILLKNALYNIYTDYIKLITND